MPDLSFITINYNGIGDTTALIESLQRIVTSVEWEVIVVDNASSHDECTQLKAHFADDARVTVVPSWQNLGFAGGNNLGIRHATGRHLMLINNDTFVEDDHFSDLIARLEGTPDIGAISPKIRFAYGQRLIQYAGFTELTPVTLRNRGIGYGQADSGQHDTPHATAFAHGAALLFSRATLQRAGAMTECYFLYYEEMDWSQQIRRAGMQIWYDPVQTIYHRESQTTGTDSPLRTYYMTRNRLLFAQRNRPMPTRLLCYMYLGAVFVMRDVTLHIIKGRKDLAAATLRGIRDFAAKRVGPATDYT